MEVERRRWWQWRGKRGSAKGDGRSHLVSLEEELELLEGFVELQQKLYPDTFVYDLQIDHGVETSRVMIPPMILQPFVENAIITLANQQVIKSSRNIGYYEKELEGHTDFIRIHSRRLVNIRYVLEYPNSSSREIILAAPFGPLKSSREGLRKLMERIG